VNKALFLVLLLLVVFPIALVNAKLVDLNINGFEADLEADAVELWGPGTFILNGAVKNNLLIEGEERDLDLVFILDASGSMQGEINAVRNSIREIIDFVNDKKPGRMKVGIYIFEGFGSSKSGFTTKGGYCAGNNDVGAIHLSDNATNLKNRLGQVNASGWIEPWAHLTSNVLNDSSWGWRTENVAKAIIVISDEPADRCSGEGSCDGCTAAANTLKSHDAFFFGIYSGSAANNMQSILNQGVKGKKYHYGNPNEIKQKILDAIITALDSDDFIVSREVGPDWDDIGTNFEVGNVGREGGYTTFTITLTTPLVHSEPFEYFQYRLKVKDKPEIYDDAWLKVWMNGPPAANINALTDTAGDVILNVEMDAQGTVDPEGELDRFEWDCESDSTIDYRTYLLNESVVCSFDEKDRTYTVTMTAFDTPGAYGSDTLEVITNPNKGPTVILEITPDPVHPNQEATFTANATDEDGTIASAEFHFGEAGVAPEFKDCAVDPGCLATTYTYPTKGDRIVEVIVTDDSGDTGNDIRTLTVDNRPPEKPVVTAVPPSGFAPLQVELRGETIDLDGDPITRWEFDYDDPNTPGTDVISCPDPTCPEMSQVHLYQVDGDFNPIARGMDSEGEWSDWSDPAVSILASNAITRLEARDILAGEHGEVAVECSDPGLVATVDIISRAGVTVHSLETQCHGLLFPTTNPDGSLYIFSGTGPYEVTANIKNEPCTNCPKSIFFIVASEVPPIRAPETSLLAIVCVAAAVLLIAGRKK